MGRGRAQHIVHGYIRISQGSWHAASGSQELPDSEGPWYLKKGFPVFPHVLRSPKSSAQREHLHNKWNPMDQIAEIQHFYGDVIYNVYIYYYILFIYIFPKMRDPKSPWLSIRGVMVIHDWMIHGVPGPGHNDHEVRGQNAQSQ